MSEEIKYKLFYRNTNVKKHIDEILHATDRDFIPALSEKFKIKDISQKYIEKAYLLIAYVNNKPAGMVAFYINSSPEDSYLSLICVVNEYRGLGIGKSLEIKCIEESKKNNSKGIAVNMRKSNVNLLDSRLKLGWKIIREYMSPLSNEVIVDMYMKF